MSRPGSHTAFAGDFPRPAGLRGWEPHAYFTESDATVMALGWWWPIPSAAFAALEDVTSRDHPYRRSMGVCAARSRQERLRPGPGTIHPRDGRPRAIGCRPPGP